MPDRTTSADSSRAAHVDIAGVQAPLAAGPAWEVESLLLRVFEYCDYSIRSALRGDYADTLACACFLARHRGVLVGAACCLHGRADHAIALIGPVGVHPDYRRGGVGTRLLSSALSYLREQNCLTAYLAVSQANPAVQLYQRFGFTTYQGIVMRLSLGTTEDTDPGAAQPDAHTDVRRVCWGDFPAVAALFVSPGSIYTCDLKRGLFSSRYVPPRRFLGVFPEMMQAFAKHGGFANVLVTGDEQRVVGIAQVQRLSAEPQHHVAEFDFYACDNFVDAVVACAQQTLDQCQVLSVAHVYAYCLSRDRTKRRILEALGGRCIAIIPNWVSLNADPVDMQIYRLEGSS